MSRWAIICTALVLMGCERATPIVEVWSILHDVTDPMLAGPDALALFRAMDVDDTEKTLVVRRRYISDVDFGPVAQLERPASPSGISALLSNSLSEQKKGEAFERACRELLAGDTLATEERSAIFDPLMDELAHLASLPQEYGKRLIVHSDMVENGHWLNLYRPRERWLLAHRPELLLERFRGHVPEGLPQIRNLQVHIIYVPRDHADNVRFKRICGIYRALFQELGIPISFSGGLPNAGPRP